MNACGLIIHRITLRVLCQHFSQPFMFTQGYAIPGLPRKSGTAFVITKNPDMEPGASAEFLEDTRIDCCCPEHAAPERACNAGSHDVLAGQVQAGNRRISVERL